MATSSIVFVLNFVFSESRRRSSPFFFLHLDAEPPLSQVLLEMPTVTLLTGAVGSVFFYFFGCLIGSFLGLLLSRLNRAGSLVTGQFSKADA